MKGSVNQGFITLLRSLNKRLRVSPDVPSYQGFREGPRGDSTKKDVIKKTFEAGMCMKTKGKLAKCPEKSRTFLSKFRTFSANRYEFCRNSGRIEYDAAGLAGETSLASATVHSDWMSSHESLGRSKL
jgi:hypothetical protein